MRTAKRITTACLTAIMIFQALAPSTEVFAQELDALTDASVAAAQSASDAARDVQDAVGDALNGDSEASSDNKESNGSESNGDVPKDDATSTGSDASGSQEPSDDQASADDAASDADDSEASRDTEASTQDTTGSTAASTGTYAITDVAGLENVLKKTGNTGKVIKDESGNVTKIEFGTNEDLLVISNTDPKIYKNAEITRDGLSGVDFDVTVPAAGTNYSFLGFGDDANPFEGSLNLDGKTLAIDKPLFNNIKLNDKNKDISVIWKGTSCQPIIAKTVDGNDQTMTATVDVKNDAKTLNAPLIGNVAGNLTLNAKYSNVSAVNISSTDNVGLFVNTVKSGKTFTVGSITVNGTKEDYFSNLSPTIKTTANGMSAGGLIGACEDNTTVVVNKSINLSSFAVYGKAASGGLIGKAVRLNLNQADGADVTCPGTVGDANSAASGGFIGDVSFAGDKEFDANKQVRTGDGVALGQSGVNGAGAVFGLLDTSNGDVTFSGGTYKSSLIDGDKQTVYGGLVGRLRDTESSHILWIKKSSDNKNCEVASSCGKQVRFAGGLVGWVAWSQNNAGGVCKVDGATISSDNTQNSEGFGGVVGALDSGCTVGGRNCYGILDCGDVTVSAKISNGAGIVGASWNCALRLRGTTDLSGCTIDDGGGTNQILKSAYSPLVFAMGSGSDSVNSNGDYWLYKRPKATAADDLSRNQVIRLTGEPGKLSKDLIQLSKDTHYQPVFNLKDGSDSGQGGGFTWGRQLWSTTGKGKSGTYQINSADRFACIAVTLQTFGIYGGLYGVGNDSYIAWLSNKNNILSIDSDIDLSGTGLTGFTNDSCDSPAPFAGTINGNGHSISLAIGEPYGTRDGKVLSANDTSDGNGKIYRHKTLGLFCADGGSTVNNLTIDGSINVDSKAVDSKADMNIAAYASVKQSGDATFTGCTFKPTVKLNQNGTTANFGYVYGGVTGGGKIDFVSGTVVDADLSSTGKLSGNGTVAGVIGQIAGSAVPTINVTDLTIKGHMSVSAARDSANTGGFIAVVHAANNNNNYKNVSISDLDLSNLSIAVQNAKKSAGGFLGYSWANTNVQFAGGKATSAVTLNEANLNISNSNNASFDLGGLVYRASGKWVVGANAIDFGGATINYSGVGTESSCGLLVCLGGNSKELNGSLYLENTAPWKTAYKVDNLTLPNSDLFSHFDEWVCDTRAEGKGIDDCGVNGVISLHTESGTLHMNDGAACNSYANRTSVGQKIKTNEWSRYFYNLDTVAASSKVTANGLIDSPEELLLWCVYKYADSNGIPIRNYFNAGDAATSNTIGGSSSDKSIDIDMTGYSYYPVDVADADVTVQNANITFCYSKIKTIENGNKPNNAKTQHMNMHASLLRNFTCGSTVSHTLAVNNVKLMGSVGTDVATDGHAGAILSGGMSGSNSSNIVRIQTLSINGLVLDNLLVDGLTSTTDNAPLVANNMGTYSTLNVTNLSMKGYSANTKAATSLFGNLGGKDADQVNATFSKIAVEGYKDDAFFTKATLLGSYAYKEGGSSNATYIFTKADDTANKVTYGKEIDSVEATPKPEYPGSQLWYYDKTLHKKEDGLVVDSARGTKASKDAFKDYLPYVAKGHDGVYHEIKVNQRVADLVAGCGTYGDPYAIANADELDTLAKYINTNNPMADWAVTIVKEQDTICGRRNSDSTDNEVTYQYKSGTWVKVTANEDGTYTETSPRETLGNDIMHTYLQSCYLSIEPTDSSTLTVDGKTFKGLGTVDYPFRGVIVGNLKDGKTTATLKIDNAASFEKGLIPYSYGSVVKNLNITYSDTAGKTVAYEKKDDTTGVPRAFWGGVIGCIMGGDNIIDGVTVSGDGFSAGEDNHLVQIGGYVGSIAGGGVIFRNMSGSSWRSGKDGFNYDNPYVGRVIDGFAFSEGCAVNNGNKNYQINKLEKAGTPCVETGDIVGKYYDDNNNEAIRTTVNNAQGLLVLSAIISSGAGGGSVYSGYPDDSSSPDYSYGTFRGSNAYAGRSKKAEGSYLFGNDSLGKVRNAKYNHVGDPKGANSSDFNVSVHDDREAPGIQNENPAGALDNFENVEVNSPYLVKAYATWQTGYVCAAKAAGMDLQFTNATYDMSGYGTGFTGLSGRYYSNACASRHGADRDRIVPLVACINGHGAKLIFDSEASQYSDDDYKLQSWGGLFSAITFTNAHVANSIQANGGYVVKDLQFGDASKKSTISLDDGSGDLGVGALAGVTANRDSLASSGKYSNVKIVNCEIESPAMAGGLLGNSGWASRATTGTVDQMVDFGHTLPSPVRLYNCGYKDLCIQGKTRVGGFVGAGAGDSNKSPIEVRQTDKDATLGKDSTIQASADGCIVGGVVGLAWSTVTVNQTSDSNDKTNYTTAALENVVIDTGDATNKNKDGGSGGIAGNAKEGCAISKVSVTSTKEVSADDAISIGKKKRNSGLIQFVGGIVGKADNGRQYSFDHVHVKGIYLRGNDSVSGVVGYLNGEVHMSCNNTVVEGCTIEGAYAGGIVGATSNTTSLVMGATNTKISQNTFVSQYTGAFSGDGKGSIRLVNVLFDKNAYTRAQYREQGLIIGNENDQYMNQKEAICAAGIDIIPAMKTGTDENAVLPDIIRTDGDIKTINSKSYISFGDYKDQLQQPDEDTPLYSDNKAVVASSPYVTTSPISDIAIKGAATDAGDKRLFGDGANVETAKEIQEEAGTTVNGRYTYTNIGGCDDNGNYQNPKDLSFDSLIDTYNKNNSDKSNQVSNDKDFKALIVPGGDTTTIEKYLNIVTNGGYSDARRLNSDDPNDPNKPIHVKAAVKTVVRTSDGGFAVDNQTTPAVSVNENGKNDMTIGASGSDWDNEKGRFTLLTVTFTEADQSYKVSVPIIVKRMLEVDFTATYSEGSNFNKADYSSKFDKHVLISSGETMTGYLTWTYNQAYGKSAEYGWNTYFASGGSAKALQKSIVFADSDGKGSMPSGTQLTLVDTKHNNKEYHYTVPAGSSAASVPLTSFVDSKENAYQEQWLSEAIGVTAQEATDGNWVQQATEDSSTGAKVDGKFYRPKTSGDDPKTTKFYSLSVSDERPKSESFYLVVRTPKKSDSVNGATTTSFGNKGVNTHINYTLRKGNGADGHQSTPSTYSIASNFEHNFVDNKSGINEMHLKGTTYPLGMDVSDTITFGKQEFTKGDRLYYQLDSSLVDYSESGTSATASGAHGYPTGTIGSCSFYVKVGDNYYVPAESTNDKGETVWTWSPAGTTETAAVTIRDWSAQASDMSLVLKDARTGTPIDLSGIRAEAIDAGPDSNGKYSFTIYMKADLTMTEPACQSGIVAATNGEKYTKPNYRAYLSTHPETLSTSSNSVYNEGEAGYFRKDLGSATIALEASDRTQLGINIDDLKSADGEIALVGTYDLSKLVGGEAKVAAGNKVTYTLSLQQRQVGGTYTKVPIGNYLTVLESDCPFEGQQDAGGDYVFTDSKSNGKFATLDGNSATFKHYFRVKVNTDVEMTGKMYANYRLVLTAKLTGGDVGDTTPVNPGGYAGYEHSDYVTYTLARINTKGIDHS